MDSILRAFRIVLAVALATFLYSHGHFVLLCLAAVVAQSVHTLTRRRARTR